jgi:ribonuclease HI
VEIAKPRRGRMGRLIRQNRAFTIMWKHFPKTTNNTMELRATEEALNFLSTWQNKRNIWMYRKFDDAQDMEFVRMRMVAI